MSNSIILSVINLQRVLGYLYRFHSRLSNLLNIS